MFTIRQSDTLTQTKNEVFFFAMIAITVGYINIEKVNNGVPVNDGDYPPYTNRYKLYNSI